MSEVIDVVGIGMWAKLFEHDRDKGSEKGVNGARYTYPEATTIQVAFDQGEFEKVRAANPEVDSKPTENGLEVKFRRNWYNATNPAWGGPPVVKDADGNPWPADKKIGNGSKVRIAVEVYQHKFGYGARLMGVKVLELVEPELPDGPDMPF